MGNVIYVDRVFDEATPLMSRADAKALGLKRYFTGKPCKHGHVAERTVCKSTCIECKSDDYFRRYAANPERMRENGRCIAVRYRAKHPEKVLISQAVWRAANRDSERERSRRWREDNPTKMREASAKWARMNPDKTTSYASARRARKSSVIVTPDADSIVRRMSSEDTFCFYCNTLLLAREVHVDHVIPLARGGPHASINFVAACAECNTRKHTKRPSEWSRLPRRKAARAIARENEIAEWIANYVLGDE